MSIIAIETSPSVASTAERTESEGLLLLSKNFRAFRDTYRRAELSKEIRAGVRALGERRLIFVFRVIHAPMTMRTYKYASVLELTPVGMELLAAITTFPIDRESIVRVFNHAGVGPFL